MCILFASERPIKKKIPSSTSHTDLAITHTVSVTLTKVQSGLR